MQYLQINKFCWCPVIYDLNCLTHQPNKGNLSIRWLEWSCHFHQCFLQLEHAGGSWDCGSSTNCKVQPRASGTAGTYILPTSCWVRLTLLVKEPHFWSIILYHISKGFNQPWLSSMYTDGQYHSSTKILSWATKLILKSGVAWVSYYTWYNLKHKSLTLCLSKDSV